MGMGSVKGRENVDKKGEMINMTEGTGRAGGGGGR
jgi:hypothetical protein